MNSNIVRVDPCWGGGERHYFRLTFPSGNREQIRGEEWTREVASQALDIAERLYGMNRKNVRFDHH